MYQHGGSAHSSHNRPIDPQLTQPGPSRSRSSARAGGDSTKAGIPERHRATITKCSYQAPNERPMEMGKQSWKYNKSRNHYKYLRN